MTKEIQKAENLGVLGEILLLIGNALMRLGTALVDHCNRERTKLTIIPEIK